MKVSTGTCDHCDRASTTLLAVTTDDEKLERWCVDCLREADPSMAQREADWAAEVPDDDEDEDEDEDLDADEDEEDE